MPASIIFSISALSLVAFIGLKLYEHKTGTIFANGTRATLDDLILRLVVTTGSLWRRCVYFVQHTILLKGLHMVTYVALVVVRYTERKLVHISHRIRSFRRDHTMLRPSTHKLAGLDEEAKNDIEQ